ncbi:MAG: hypothetical protein ACRD1K_11420 [Acidimicrobiales bacterium]
MGGLCANVAKAVAKRRVALGRSLRHLPAAESAWLAGGISQSRVSALARARTPVTEEAMERDEAGRPCCGFHNRGRHRRDDEPPAPR